MFPFNILDYFSFGKKRLQSEREELIQELAVFRDRLVPWENEDLNLLSFTVVDKKHYRSSGKGLFVSIYDEPSFAYGCKVFNHKNLDRLIMAETANHHMLYIKRKGFTEFYFNNQLVGKYVDSKDLLYSPRKRLIARINHSSADKTYTSIIFKDRELAVIHPFEANSKFNKRVFDILKGNISTEEEVILICLTFHYLVKKSMNLN